jgi:phage gp46-like protein
MDALIDPATGAYVADAARIGELARDPANGLLNAAYLRLMVPLGSWFADPSLGSRLHELARAKDLDRVELLARQYATEALQPLITAGRARSVNVTTERQGLVGGATTRLALMVELVDARGVASAFAMHVKVI